MKYFLAVIGVGFCLFGIHDRACAEPGQIAKEALEKVQWEQRTDGVRVCLLSPPTLDSNRSRDRRLLVYATPNGNSIEETLGCVRDSTTPWRFDIQHVAAQFRKWRSLDRHHEWILAVVEAPQKSWPNYARHKPDAAKAIAKLIASLQEAAGAERFSLAAHSGGGSLLFNFLDSHKELPTTLERLIFLDANYSYSAERQHGDKLLQWLRADATHRLVVLAYDDRNVELNGKRVVGPDGGTYRASHRMLERFRRDIELDEREQGPFFQASGLDGRLEFLVHRNPQNKILHTALVGDMNGLLYAMAQGTPVATDWGKLGGPRAYSDWIPSSPFTAPLAQHPQSPPSPMPSEPDGRLPKRGAVISQAAPAVMLDLPPRRHDAINGSDFAARIERLSLQEREAEIQRQILAGNVPESLRRLTPIHVTHIASQETQVDVIYYVTTDYLGVGTDTNWFRTPVTPRTALTIADATHCTLITPKISDDIHQASPIKLPPKPLTKDRESVATFFLHHQTIETQLRPFEARPLVAGIKKDLVWTQRLREKPHREAIYGWHYPDGRPIQPLYIGHVAHYVDYSHGLRLLANRIKINERWLSVEEVLANEDTCGVLSGEGPLIISELRGITSK
jgi:pimeloyl-ACP methyl ester carboxylesterase